MYRVNRNKSLSQAERGAIIALTQEGKSIGQISNSVGCGRSTVVLWQNRFLQTGDIQRKTGSGRPRSTTPEQDQEMRQFVEAQPITNSASIAGKKSLNNSMPKRFIIV